MMLELDLMKRIGRSNSLIYFKTYAMGSLSFSSCSSSSMFIAKKLAMKDKGSYQLSVLSGQ